MVVSHRFSMALSSKRKSMSSLMTLSKSRESWTGTALHSSSSQMLTRIRVNDQMKWSCSRQAYLTMFRRKNCYRGYRHRCCLMEPILAKTNNNTIKILPIIRWQARMLLWKIAESINSWRVLNLNVIHPLLRVRRTPYPTVSRQAI